MYQNPLNITRSKKENLVSLVWRVTGESSKEDDIKEGQQQAITSDYEERMEITIKFKQDRAEKAKTMSRELCLLKGRQKFN